MKPMLFSAETWSEYLSRDDRMAEVSPGKSRVPDDSGNWEPLYWLSVSAIVEAKPIRQRHLRQARS